MRVRIVSWNCQMALYKKFDQLLSLRPDIAIIPECASPEKDARKGRQLPCTGREWIGFNEDKGLGIFWFNGIGISVYPRYSDKLQLYLPVEVRGPCEFHLLAAWMAEKRSIPAGTNNGPKDAVEYYQGFLTAKAAVVAGDFNYYPPVDELYGMGLESAHCVGVQGPMCPPPPHTHYHKRKLDSRPIAVDYLFVPTMGRMRLAHFEVGDPQQWIKYSDHMPLIADLDVVDGPAPRLWWARLRGRLLHGRSRLAAQRLLT